MTEKQGRGPGRPVVDKMGVRLNGYLSGPASDHLKIIMKEFGTTKYDIISTAVVFYAKAMEGKQLFVPKKENPVRQTPQHRSQNQLKAIWCEELGGVIDGSVCHIDKYETTLAGTVEVHKRSIPIGELPDSKEDMMSYVLGGFDSLKEAQDASTKKK
jgi:hypothetical protein